MMTIGKVRETFHRVCKGAGVVCDSPIEVNRRLTSTLGRVKSNYNSYTGYCEPFLVEFSAQLLENADEAYITEIIKHEAAHYIVGKRTHEKHGHDALFKAVCAELGTSFDKTHASEDFEHTSKYDIYCDTCNAIIAKYSRRSKTFTAIECGRATCNQCHKTNLRIIQNW